MSHVTSINRTQDSVRKDLGLKLKRKCHIDEVLDTNCTRVFKMAAYKTASHENVYRVEET